MDIKRSVGRPSMSVDEKRVKRPLATNQKEWEKIERNAEELSSILGTKEGNKKTNNFLCYVGTIDIDILRKAINEQEKRGKL